MNKLTATSILLLLLCALLPAARAADPQPAPAATNQILFLQVHLEQGRLTIVKSTRVPGVLKTPRQAPRRNVLFSLESTNGTALWSGWMDDPSVRRFEYPDATVPGVLRTRFLTNDPGDFYVRVPQTPGADKLSFYRLSPVSAPAATPALVGATTNSAPAQQLMDSVILPRD